MLADQISAIARVYDRQAAARLAAELRPAIPDASDRVLSLIESIGSASPYLSRSLLSRRQDLGRLFYTPLEETLSGACDIARAAADGEDIAAQMRQLREAKNLTALAIALAEISGAWPTMKAAAALSDFADAALTGAVRASLREMMSKGFAPRHEARPEIDSGLAIIAMGKLGARELNYSSDIDIIVLYDPSARALGGDSAREIAVGAARHLVRMMQEQTKDGYVFRTDLRLRPDPGASAAAVSVNAAETYYEAHGQNWERAAFIKARAAAGDIALGEQFLQTLRPFIWRKYLDFAAIEDIHSIKRQIHAAKGGASIDFFGHDLKTGQGGIREIEFLAQTQQLILGGKNPALRSRPTLDALGALCADKQIAAETRADLDEAYVYLRRVEHRIQMINDEQTHKIPAKQEDVERLAAFLGEADGEAFRRRLVSVLHTTHRHFADLFEQEDRLSTDSGSLIFTGVENNPHTLASLTSLGFKRPETVSDTVRHWHAGGIRATNTARARALLTKLIPHLLESLAAASDPDEAFVAFDKFLARLPSGVQIFSLFANSPDVFDRLIRTMTVAPYLGRDLARRRHLVEALLEQAWPSPLPSRKALEDALSVQLRRAQTFEDSLNAARRWAAEEKFQIAAQLVIGHIGADTAAPAFTAVGDTIIKAMAPVVAAQMEQKHGAIDGDLVIIGLGRLGAGVLTATSDVDLMFIYDAPDGAMSTGAKPLDAVTYFTRLVRRYVTALTAATEEGSLYDVDMQLRPSGGAGPAAVSKTAFVKYFADDAWTWEVMALTKARAICGDQALNDFLQAEIQRIIARPREAGALAKDVHDMRLRLIDAKPTRGLWDVKRARGGLIDLDFIHQYLQLMNGARFEWRDCSQIKVKGADREVLKRLAEASGFYETIIQLSRAAIGGVYSPQGSGLALRMRMSQACETACGPDSLEAAESLIVRTQHDVGQIYADLIENAVRAVG